MKRKTILKHDDFVTPKDGISSHCEYFMVRTKPAKIPNDPRYGIIVSKRTFKLAVQRNRAKRMLRDWIAVNENIMNPDLDYVIIAFNTILGASRDLGREKMRKILRRIARIYERYGYKKHDLD